MQAQLPHTYSSNSKRGRSLQWRWIHLVHQNYHLFLLPKRPAPILSNSHRRDHEFNGHYWDFAILQPTRGSNVKIRGDQNPGKNLYNSTSLKIPYASLAEFGYVSGIDESSRAASKCALPYKAQKICKPCEEIQSSNFRFSS